MPHWLRTATAVIFIASTAAAVQFDTPGRPHQSDPEYDGRFTLVRLRWASDIGFSRRGGFGSAWNHDYPRAEQNLALILQELTALDIRIDGKPDSHARRSRAVQVPRGVHVGARFLESLRS
ncbi:MAG: hypothetical protein LC753_11460 [Acidobacteria bacterium]|nr:hypothetical protein [Acidobacteriota bacterium]MCA1650857.1 hypothetical protein [Acidobacteriota bacterium]